MNSDQVRELYHPRLHSGLAPRACAIAGVGSYVPVRVMRNAELEKKVATTDEWITTRTGIRERRIAADKEFTSDLAAEAARRAMAKAAITPDQIDLIIVATITPDTPFPSTACWVQKKIGAQRAAAFDIEAACSGFLYALEIGQQFVSSRTFDTVLVIGAEKLSSIIDWQDRNTCVLFGDGAGAVILQNRPDTHGLLTVCLGADGSKTELLGMPGGGSRCPATRESVDARLHYLKMDGKETFKNAVTAMCTAARDAMKRCRLEIDQIACVIPHQANRRIIDAVADRLGAKPAQVFVNLDKYGNTSAASVAIALDEAVQSNRIKQGDLVLMVVFGAGFTWASAVIEW
jgi:3-oxoacyl-[acyl-carrier-protein] synthase III